MNRPRVSESPAPHAPPPSGTAEVVDAALEAKPVQPVSRGVTLVLGSVTIVAAVVAAVLPLVTLVTSGLSKFVEVAPVGLVMGFVCFMLARKFLRGARTGLDPDPEDRAMEAMESRAFLAEVEKHEATGETPPGHAPPGSI